MSEAVINDLIVHVTMRQVYGTTCIYPSCELAYAFADLAKQKTLTQREIKIIKSLGYRVLVHPTAPTEL